jgi:hypothetical protein
LKKLTERRHPEWAAHNLLWRWLVDSYEGGSCYRDAVYGNDTKGLPVRNLVRHKFEYPQPGDTGNPHGTLVFPGDDQAIAPTDNDYELRRARTPVPSFVKEAIEEHLGRIYAKEVDREAVEALETWWEDVDGLGTDIGRWMQETVGPMLVTLGCLDVLIDHPAAPPNALIATDADAIALGLKAAIASVVLPEDVLWWELDPATRRYKRVLILRSEVMDDGQVKPRYHHWDANALTIHDEKGNALDTIPHAFGRVPMIRLFDRRKPRTENVGASRMEATAEYQREFYNRDSELILSDTTQAHPLLQGPEDYVQADGSIPIGPSWLLPKKKSMAGTTVEYEPFEVLEFPKGGAESIRLNKQDLRDASDRANCLAKPAGTTQSNTVAQSGVSKAFDHAALAARLGSIAETLEEAESQIATLALVVLTDGQPESAGTIPGDDADDTADPEPFDVTYPRVFDVVGPDELGKGILDLQSMLADAGTAPDLEASLIKSYVRVLMPGRDEQEYTAYDEAIDKAVKERADERKALVEVGLAERQAGIDPIQGPGDNPGPVG